MIAIVTAYAISDLGVAARVAQRPRVLAGRMSAGNDVQSALFQGERYRLRERSVVKCSLEHCGNPSGPGNRRSMLPHHRGIKQARGAAPLWSAPSHSPVTTRAPLKPEYLAGYGERQERAYPGDNSNGQIAMQPRRLGTGPPPNNVAPAHGARRDHRLLPGLGQMPRSAWARPSATCRVRARSISLRQLSHSSRRSFVSRMHVTRI